MSDLDNIIQQIGDNSAPPVHLWKPDFCGDINIHIDAQGVWFHEGTPIGRESLVNLFASVLWYEDDEYYLVTPVEKMRITVDDVPFIVVNAGCTGGRWVAATKPVNSIMISEANPVELRCYKGDWVPYLCVRYNLWARVNRNVYYQWIDAALAFQGECDPAQGLSLTSGTYRFPIAKEL